MQSNPAMQPEPPLSRSRQGRQGLIKGLFFGGALIFIASLLIVYLAWDYMPARVQYIPRYVQSNFLPARAHPASVPTPVAAVAPEDALASLDFDEPTESKTAQQKQDALSLQAQAEEGPQTELNEEAESATEAIEEPSDEAIIASDEAETASDEAETASDEAETASDEAEVASDEAQTASNEAEATSDEAQMASDEAEMETDEAEMASDEAQTASDEAEVASDEAEMATDEAETASDETQTASDEAETASDETQTASDEAETVSDEAEAASDEAEMASDEAETASEEGASSAEENAASDSVLLEPIYAQAGPKAVLNGITHEYQGWNNCGPATLGMQLSFFGRLDKQADTAPFLKPEPSDKNVSPDEMIAYAHSIGYGGQVVVGMDLEMLRTFTANELPIIVESWYIPDPDDEMGHYLLLTGYEGNTLTFYDSYNGPDVQEQADEFDELWKVFNRTALVVWPPEKEELATAILGDLTDSQAMYERALATAHAEVKANPQDKYAWFNLGSNLTVLGDIPNAVKAFDTARSLELPWRMLWYQFGPYQAYFENGQYEEVIALTTTTLDSSDDLEESYYWRGRAKAALGELDAARSDLEEAARLNKHFTPAQSALDALP